LSFVVGAVVPWTACGEPAGGDLGSVRRDSVGIEIVTDGSSGWDASEAWRLELDLQVGEVDGPLAFGRINWVAPGPDGGMLVLDGQSHHVHVFAADGSRLASFGGEGDGPGEFRRPAAVTLLEDGRLVVAQGFPPVLHWLTADGAYEAATRLPGARDMDGTRTVGTFALWQLTSSGQAFAQVQVIDPGAEDGEMPVLLLALSDDPGGDPDTIAEWTWRAPVGDEPIRLFEPVPTWMPRADGTVLVAPGEPYEIREYDPAVGLVRVVRRDVPPPPVTETLRALAVSDVRAGMESGGAPDRWIEDMLARARSERDLPSVLQVWVSDPDGRAWVGVHDPDLSESDQDAGLAALVNAWDVFERDGRYLGRIPVPHGFRLRVVTADMMYGMWEDELEVPFARRYRIVRPPGSAR
jgi:hypothetical protein